jgi:septal ring factor EnvC (AmiA/AmiB activator)
LTIRAKVAEPQILAKLQQELLLPKNVSNIAKAVEREAKKALAASKDSSTTRKQLEQERRKLQNLLAALEGGSDAPSSVLKAIADREKSIAKLEREVETTAERPRNIDVGDLTKFVECQLADLHSLLKADVLGSSPSFGGSTSP